jgi:hypothetical protein
MLMRRHALFIGLLIIIAAVRLTILLASQTHVHSDEAIIGLMGKHILERRYFPFCMYGQTYNAGAAWEAYLAAIAFAFFSVQRDLLEKLRRRPVVALPFSILPDVCGPL